MNFTKHMKIYTCNKNVVLHEKKSILLTFIVKKYRISVNIYKYLISGTSLKHWNFRANVIRILWTNVYEILWDNGAIRNYH